MRREYHVEMEIAGLALSELCQRRGESKGPAAILRRALNPTVQGLLRIPPRSMFTRPDTGAAGVYSCGLRYE